MLPSFSLLLPAFGLLVNKKQTKSKSSWSCWKFKYLFSCSQCKGGTENWTRETWSSRLIVNHSRTNFLWTIKTTIFKNFQEPAATELMITKLLQNTNRSFALAVVKKKKRMHIHYKNWNKTIAISYPQGREVVPCQSQLGPFPQKTEHVPVFLHTWFLFAMGSCLCMICILHLVRVPVVENLSASKKLPQKIFFSRNFSFSRRMRCFACMCKISWHLPLWYVFCQVLTPT